MIDQQDNSRCCSDDMEWGGNVSGPLVFVFGMIH